MITATKRPTTALLRAATSTSSHASEWHLSAKQPFAQKGRNTRSGRMRGATQASTVAMGLR